MKSNLIVFLLLFLFYNMNAQELHDAATMSWDVLLNDLKLDDPNLDFFDCPNENNPSNLSHTSNGWGGAQVVLAAMLNYERTKNPKYYAFFDPSNESSWTFWLENESIYQSYWGTPHRDASGGTASTSEMVVHWSDDAGWLINIYKLIYDYTGTEYYLDSAYKMLTTTDSEYAYNYNTTNNSRVLKYKHNIGVVKGYIIFNILGALELYKEYKRLNNLTRANVALEIACQYYNFFENYMHSDGSSRFTRTNVAQIAAIPRDMYAYQMWLDIELPTNKTANTYEGYVNSRDINQNFTAVQMIAAVIYFMFQEIENEGEPLLETFILDPNHRDFENLGITAANYVINSCSENSRFGPVLINGIDVLVNGFSFYWWVKYVVPQNQADYGNIIINTAKSIVDNNDLSSPLTSCWNSPYIENPNIACRCNNSESIFYPNIQRMENNRIVWYEEFMWHSTSMSVIAAGALLESKDKNNYLRHISSF